MFSSAVKKVWPWWLDGLVGHLAILFLAMTGLVSHLATYIAGNAMGDLLSLTLLSKNTCYTCIRTFTGPTGLSYPLMLYV